MTQHQSTVRSDARTNHAEILLTGTIERICAIRDAALEQMALAAATMEDAHRAASAADGLAKQAYGASGFHFADRARSDAYSRLFASIDAEHSLEAYRRYVDASTWKQLLDLTGMTHLMDRTAKEAFDKDLAGDVPEVTVDNVRATLEGLAGDAGLIFQRGLARAFIDLDRRFRSHDGFKIGSRIVLTNVFDSWGSFNYHSKMRDTITDIERVFAVLDGAPGQVGSLVEQIRRDREGGFSPRQSFTESTYFRVRTYKNGNAHLWFTRDDLVEKANLVLADYYGDVLPDAEPGDAEREHDLRSKAGLPSCDLAFYATPGPVVTELLNQAGLGYRPEECRVLEPSAGTGNIAASLVALGVKVDCVEIHEGRAAQIRHRLPGTTVWCTNFLRMDPVLSPTYTHIVMNPPFSGTHWMEHVVHASSFLAPGGKLVAVLPVSAELGDSNKHRTFRAWAEGLFARWRDLPPESFVESGTRINTCILRLLKPSR